MDKQYSFEDLIEIIAVLTGQNGCPWDKAQTHESIIPNMLEEAEEAVEAIKSGKREDIIEELGDVLLQPLFHADMARRAGEFTVSDIINKLCDKLISRHTHIFGADKAVTAEDALRFWNEAKAREKQNK